MPLRLIAEKGGCDEWGDFGLGETALTLIFCFRLMGAGPPGLPTRPVKGAGGSMLRDGEMREESARR